MQTDEKPNYVRGINGETICVGDRVLDTRPDGARGRVIEIIDDKLVMVKIGGVPRMRDICVAARHLSVIL